MHRGQDNLANITYPVGGSEASALDGCHFPGSAHDRVLLVWLSDSVSSNLAVLLLSTHNPVTSLGHKLMNTESCSNHRGLIMRAGWGWAVGVGVYIEVGGINKRHVLISDLAQKNYPHIRLVECHAEFIAENNMSQISVLNPARNPLLFIWEVWSSCRLMACVWWFSRSNHLHANWDIAKPSLFYNH